jgi:hypothetical protein
MKILQNPKLPHGDVLSVGFKKKRKERLREIKIYETNRLEVSIYIRGKLKME